MKNVLVIAGLMALLVVCTALPAWLLMVVLSWFGVKAPFWICVAIVFLVNFATTKVDISNK